MPETSADKIRVEELRIEKIAEGHASLLKEFKSYEKELVNFLIEDALNNQKQKLSVTSLWFYDKNLMK